MCLNHSLIAATDQNLKPTHYILSINSPQLDYEIFVNLDKLDETTSEAILLKFEKHDQSNMAKGRESVISGPFQIDVTAIELKTKENKRKQKRPGAAYEHHRRIRLKPIHFEINKDAIVELDNNDRFCLFRSILWNFKRKTLDRRRFHEFKNDEAAQTNAVMDLLNATGIDSTHLYYDIQDYGQQIQNYIDDLFPNRFKLFAFENEGKYRKPFWKSNKSHFEEDISIFYWTESSHYEPIKSIKLLWDKDSRFKYCFSVIKLGNKAKSIILPYSVKHLSKQAGGTHPDAKQNAKDASKLAPNSLVSMMDSNIFVRDATKLSQTGKNI